MRCVTHASRVGFDPGWSTSATVCTSTSTTRPLNVHRGRVHDFEDLVRVRTVWRAREQRGHIVQPEVLFPRQLALDVGGLDVHNHRTMDYELWGKFLLAGAAFQYTQIPFGMFRLHGRAEDRTELGADTVTGRDGREARRAGARYARTGAPDLVADLRAYEREYWREHRPAGSSRAAGGRGASAARDAGQFAASRRQFRATRVVVAAIDVDRRQTRAQTFS